MSNKSRRTKRERGLDELEQQKEQKRLARQAAAEAAEAEHLERMKDGLCLHRCVNKQRCSHACCKKWPVSQPGVVEPLLGFRQQSAGWLTLGGGVLRDKLLPLLDIFDIVRLGRTCRYLYQFCKDHGDAQAEQVIGPGADTFLLCCYEMDRDDKEMTLLNALNWDAGASKRIRNYATLLERHKTSDHLRRAIARTGGQKRFMELRRLVMLLHCCEGKDKSFWAEIPERVSEVIITQPVFRWPELCRYAKAVAAALKVRFRDYYNRVKALGVFEHNRILIRDSFRANFWIASEEIFASSIKAGVLPAVEDIVEQCMPAWKEFMGATCKSILKRQRFPECNGARVSLGKAIVDYLTQHQERKPRYCFTPNHFRFGFRNDHIKEESVTIWGDCLSVWHLRSVNINVKIVQKKYSAFPEPPLQPEVIGFTLSYGVVFPELKEMEDPLELDARIKQISQDSKLMAKAKERVANTYKSDLGTAHEIEKDQ